MINQSKPHKLIAVVGPTGSGKTEYAVELARAINGVIISADSRQVYRKLDIGSNKVGQKSNYHGFSSRIYQGVDQLLIDSTSAGRRFTLFNWLEEANLAVEAIWQNNQIPIVAGGTGLYVSALIEGYELPKQIETLDLDSLSLSELQAKVAPNALNPSDYANPVRLKNYLKRIEPPKKKTSLHFESKVFFIERDRDELVKKASQRFKNLAPEIIEEVDNLILSGVSKEWIDSLGLDYRYALQLKTQDQEEIFGVYEKAVRQFIKRQETWWRGYQNINYLQNYIDLERKASEFLKDG